MKKILALVLAVVLVMGLATTAFADSITAKEGTSTQDVTATYVDGSEATVYKVDVTWGSMEFTYTSASNGTWLPDSHEYKDAVAAAWTCDADANKITVTNHSNAAVTVDLAYANAPGYEAITGTLSTYSINLLTAVGTEVAAAPNGSATLTLTGDLGKTAETVTVGTITVTLK